MQFATTVWADVIHLGATPRAKTAFERANQGLSVQRQRRGAALTFFLHLQHGWASLGIRMRVTYRRYV